MSTKTTVNSLEKLGAAYNESLVPRPKLPEIIGLTTDEAVLQRLREGASEIRRWTVSTLAQLDTLAQAPRELRELNEDKIAEAKKAFLEYLDADPKVYRRACWLGTLEQRFSAPVTSKTEAQAVIDGLVQEELLERTEGGPLKAFGNTYAVPANSTFKEPEIAEVAGFLQQLLQRAFLAEREAKIRQATVLYDQSELSVDELLGGKAGRITLGVPPEPMLEHGEPVRNGDGSPRWRGGGTLLVESDGNKVWPIGASGNIERGVQEAIALKVHLLLYTLGWEFPPRIQGLELEKAKKVTLLWNLLRRGINAEKRNQEIRTQKAGLVEGVKPISMKEFFVDGQPGTCLVELSKPWEPLVATGEPPVYINDMFFLVERFVQASEDGDGKKTFVKIVGTASHINEYLASCMGEYAEDDKFGGCPQPLRAILQAAFGQAVKEAHLAEKYPRNDK
jgi:hypothetical protein